MLAAGTFTYQGVRYSTTRIEFRNYARFDIHDYQSQFQVDFGSVRYSYYQKRGDVRSFGNPELGDAYNSFIGLLTTSPGASTEESGWERGNFVTTKMKVINNDTYIKIKSINGITREKQYVSPQTLIVEVVQDPEFNVDMSPLNFSAYSKMTISEKDTGLNVIGDYLPLEVLRQRFNLSWVSQVDYEVVSPENVQAELKRVADTPSDTLVGFDFETTSLIFNAYEHGDVVGLVISVAPDESRYFPFRHFKFQNLDIKILDELLDICATKTLVAHNKKFEHHVLLSLGRRYYPIHHDSLQASCLNDPRQLRGLHDLKSLGQKLTGREFLELTDIFVDNHNIDFRILDKETTRVYACPDADSCVKVLIDEFHKMPAHARSLYDLECRVASLKAEQEYWGFRIDHTNFSHDYEATLKIYNKLEKIIKSALNMDINLNSGKQLADLIYGRMRCPVIARTKTGEPSTGAKALSLFSAQKIDTPRTSISKDVVDMDGNVVIKASALNSARYPVILVLSTYKIYNKLITAFFKRFRESTYQDRYFAWINQNGAQSGRQSSPMHQLPKTLKRDILPDSEDHILLDVDYSQMELRIFASYAGEEQLVERMHDPEIDIHRLVTELVTGVPMHLISKEMRSKFKATNFGVVYGIGPRGLAQQIHGLSATAEQIKEAKDSIDDFYRTFKRMRIFRDQIRSYALRTGKSHTKFGRTRYFPDLLKEGTPQFVIASDLRKAGNLPIQGTGADLTKMAEVNFNDYIRREGWDEIIETPQGRFPKARVMLSIHDEVLISLHRDLARDVPKILQMVKECMEFQVEDWAPLFTAASFADNWEEGHSGDYEIPVGLRDKILEEGTLYLKSDNIKEELKAVIAEYQDTKLFTYMDNTIKEAGSLDANVIFDYVKHPTLTHDLIARFGPNKKYIAKHGKMSHEDMIRFAIKSYIEWRKDNGGEALEVEGDKEAIYSPDTESPNLAYEIETLLTDSFNYTQDGNVTEEVNDEDEFLVTEALDDEQLQAMPFESQDEARDYIYELFDAIIVDVEHLTEPQVNRVLGLLFENNDEKGFSEIKLLYHGELIDTKIKCESVANAETIKDYIKKARYTINA